MANPVDKPAVSTAQTRYVWGAYLALAWAIADTAYAYLVLHAERFRAESASIILVAVLAPLLFWHQHRTRHIVTLDPRLDRYLIELAVGLWLVILVPFITLPFLSDDYVFLVRYQHWSDVLTPTQFFRPTFAVVFFLLAKLGHGSPVVFHAAAWLLHITSASCVYVLADRLFRRKDAAVFCGGTFLLNPLQLEAVLWVSGLQELLWTAFVLAALVIYTGTAQLTVGRLAATLGLLMVAMFSKETAISAVLMLPIVDWVMFQFQRGRLWLTAYAGAALTSVVYLVVRTQVAPVESTFFVRPEKYFVQKFLATPYRFFAQPWNLAAASISDFVLWSAAVGLFVVLCVAIVRGAGPRTLVGPFIILATTIPVYSYFYVTADLRGTRYLYCGAFGWAVLLTQLVMTAVDRRRVLLMVFASVMGVYAVSLRVNAQPWQDANEIVNMITTGLRDGRPIDAVTAECVARYGNGLEIQNGRPVAYKGVYLFLNGFDELRSMTAIGAGDSVGRR